jgi:hypothetical protein
MAVFTWHIYVTYKFKRAEKGVVVGFYKGRLPPENIFNVM